jgi:hypothetical protein
MTYTSNVMFKLKSFSLHALPESLKAKEFNFFSITALTLANSDIILLFSLPRFLELFI